MIRTITCKDTEIPNSCLWSFDEGSMTELMLKIKEHVLAQHKEIEWNPENIEIIKSQIKTKVFKDGVQVESGRFWWWGEKMEKVNRLIVDKKQVRPKIKRERLGFKKSGLM